MGVLLCRKLLLLWVLFGCIGLKVMFFFRNVCLLVWVYSVLIVCSMVGCEWKLWFSVGVVFVCCLVLR